jgi:hypothetical protein
MQAGKLLGTIVLCLMAASAHAAGFRALHIQASANAPAISGAVWYPCSRHRAKSISARSPCRV